LVAVDCDAGGVNLTAYAVAGEQGRLSVTIINKDALRDVEVSISIPKEFVAGQAFRLNARSLESKEGVTFAGASVSGSGKWTAGTMESVHSKGGRCEIRVPAGSAALLKWGGHGDSRRR
jgi:hypothetical protein